MASATPGSRMRSSAAARSAIAEVRGDVVLLNFWTRTCINWLRQEPYVRAWSQTYRDDGLAVIGVHTPEFWLRARRGADAAGRREERGIDYPVAVDNEYAIWSAFDNHYWPALYFADREGVDSGQPLRRGPLRGIRAHDPAAARYRARARLRRRARRGSGGRLGPPAHARDVSRLRAQRALRLTRRRLPRRTPRLRVPRTARLQRLGARGRVDDRARECRTRGGWWEHRLPLSRARRASRALPGAPEPFPSACSSMARFRAPHTAWTSTRTGTACSGTAASTAGARARGIRERTLEITLLEPGAEAYVFTSARRRQ